MGGDRHEPTFTQFRNNPEYEMCKGQFEKKGWMGFLQKFQGYNDRVAMLFAQRYTGKIAKVRSLKIKVTKNLISKATILPLTGEKYFKGESPEWDNCAKFLKLVYKYINWLKGGMVATHYYITEVCHLRGEVCHFFPLPLYAPLTLFRWA